MADNTADLPSSNSPDLVLRRATPQETRAAWELNAEEWRGRLSLEAYLRREELLGEQTLTKDGGITYWILVDGNKDTGPRPILASCESLCKKALIARGDGQVEEIISHGIGSVFCDPKYRGKGYARRMIQELGDKLDTWRQVGEGRTDFTVLYSDIGKEFYAKARWEAFTSSHIALSPIEQKDTKSTHSDTVNFLSAADLPNLCELDETQLKKALSSVSESDTIQVALVPDVDTMRWHHAREEFVAQELLGRVPKTKGATVQCTDGSQVWCIWSHFFGNESNHGNTLNILRLVIEGEAYHLSDSSGNVTAGGDGVHASQEKVDAVASLLQAARHDAADWSMHEVQIWNPTRTVIQAAQKLEPSTKVIHRKEDSIASLRWHKADTQIAKVHWIGNEKFGWC